jgi:hypothetical protein
MLLVRRLFLLCLLLFRVLAGCGAGNGGPVVAQAPVPVLAVAPVRRRAKAGVSRTARVWDWGFVRCA